MSTTNKFKLATATNWVSNAFGFTEASFEDDFISSNSEEAFKKSTKINLVIETISEITNVDTNTIFDAISIQIMDTSGGTIDFSDDATIETILSNARIPDISGNPTTAEIVAIANSKVVAKNIDEIIDASGVSDFEADEDYTNSEYESKFNKFAEDKVKLIKSLKNYVTTNKSSVINQSTMKNNVISEKENFSLDRLRRNEVATEFVPSESDTAESTIQVDAIEVIEVPSFQPTNKTQLFTAVDEWLEGSRTNGNIKRWDVSLIEDFSELFKDGRAKTVGSGFIDASGFNDDITTWKPIKATNMSSMFEGASSFNQTLYGWSTRKVTNMSNMFKNATAFNGNVTNWNISNVTNISGCFEGAIAFDVNIGSWNLSSVLNASSMFKNATSFNKDLTSWNVSNIENMTSMFEGATSFNKYILHWVIKTQDENQQSVTVTFTNMFKDATAFNTIYNNLSQQTDYTDGETP